MVAFHFNFNGENLISIIINYLGPINLLFIELA